MSWTGYQHRDTDAAGWTTFWRLDPRGEGFALTDWTGYPDRPGHRLWVRAATPAGVRGRWRTSARSVCLQVRAEHGIYTGIAPVDVLVDGTLHARRAVQEGQQRLEVDLEPGAHEIEIWLPQAGVIAVREPVFDGTADPVATDGPHWITYGSSITQCAGADGPSETWPALVARRQGWNLRALGFAGECHLDPIAARTIRDNPADLISLCLGINVFGGSTFSGRTLPSAVEAFVATVRSGHPETPIVVITPLVAPNVEGKPNEVGLTLDTVRDLVELGARRDPAVTVVDGRDILTADEARELYADDLHPGPDGYRLIAERLAPQLATRSA
ncbi:GDSL-type esterase/lipase family protein [Kribbella sp. NPDC048915]|uniref:GDSL-type esterase/lipase family protein n=1 Tax=Kribbella sp. NPDC048915 TaxID=3155148 RepID=UPI00340DD414